MGLGSMRFKVTLQSATRTTDDGGGAAVAWSNDGTLWANITPISGKEDYRQSQVQDSITHRIKVRYKSSIETKDRLKFGSRFFNIKSVINVDERKKYMELLCEEGVAI